MALPDQVWPPPVTAYSTTPAPRAHPRYAMLHFGTDRLARRFGPTARTSRPCLYRRLNRGKVAVGTPSERSGAASVRDVGVGGAVERDDRLRLAVRARLGGVDARDGGDRGDLSTELAFQVRRHAGAPRPPGGVYAVRVDAEACLGVVDERSGEGEVGVARFEGAELALTPEGWVTGVGRDDDETTCRPLLLELAIRRVEGVVGATPMEVEDERQWTLPGRL